MLTRSMPPSIAHHVLGCPAFVPGIRLCGHSHSLFCRSPFTGDDGYFCRKQRERETATIRALADQCRKKFVLLRTCSMWVRVITDPASCFQGRAFVLCRTKRAERWNRFAEPSQAEVSDALGVIVTVAEAVVRRFPRAVSITGPSPIVM